jgi:hypothetical protein
MRIENYYLGAYWGSRKESSLECAERTLALLQGLSFCDEAFQRWFQRGRSRHDALARPIELDRQVLQQLFERGVNRRDERSVIEDLGFRIGLWNGGADDEAVGLSALCGCFASTGMPRIPNSCTLDLPSKGRVAERVLRADVLLDVIRSVVRAFEPDYAVVTSDAFRDLVGIPEPGRPLLGWITFLPVSGNHLPALPPPSRILPVDSLGSLVVVTEGRFTVTNPEHLIRANRVRDLLTAAGLLGRVN